MNLMGIDMGTTSVKTAVFDDKLNEKIKLTADYTLESKGDRVEFEAEKYWDIVSGEVAKIKAELDAEDTYASVMAKTAITENSLSAYAEVKLTADDASLDFRGDRGLADRRALPRKRSAGAGNKKILLLLLSCKERF